MSCLPVSDQILRITGEAPLETTPLHGGCIAQVQKLAFKNHAPLVIKIADKNAVLDLEGRMLQYLKEHSQLPVPNVLYSSNHLLVMGFIEGQSRFNAQAETHAAELLSELHQIKSEGYGFEYDTLIGALPQPNTQTSSWLEFFTQHRILHMATLAHAEGVLSASLLQRLETFCARAETWLDEPEHPALLHGDAWTTNMLANDNGITGFIDPAVYYGHFEMELAFTTLFGTFSDNGPFFKRYAELNPGWDAKGFFELRRDLCNLYPLLVHVRLFGNSYTSGVDRTLKRIGL